jgi:hypothetical protein
VILFSSPERETTNYTINTNNSNRSDLNLEGGVEMTADEFRNLALELPGTVESAHMNHPDFRVGGKIFATLGPREEWGMVKLTPEQQSAFVEAEPAAFEPVKGSWGVKGATKVNLESAHEPGVSRALDTAWRNTAPDALIKKYDK